MPGFSLRMAARDLRASGRRLGLFLASVSAGVAAIVAVSGFKANVVSSLEDQGRLLLGADVELESRFAFPPEVEAVLDSVAGAGAGVARVTSVPSMVRAESSGRTALLTVRAGDPAYPFYGTVETTPPGAWERLGTPGVALVETGASARIGAAPGDTVQVGVRRFELLGVVDRIPGDPGIRSAVNPRLYIPATELAATELIQPGSLAMYRAFLRFESRPEARRFVVAHRELFVRHAVAWDTSRERERDLARAFDALARYLGLAGLGALLLGGIGVASAMTTYVRERRPSAAVLRCLGVSGWGLVRIYVLQAATLALAGSVIGVAVGVGLQAVLPSVLGELLPLDAGFAIDPGAVAAGLGAGLWTAVLFAWLAILPIRDVPALGAVREAALGAEGSPGRRARSGAERLTWALLAGTVIGLAVWQAGEPVPGLVLAGGVGITLLALSGASRLLMAVARRTAPREAPFALRQGIANLFRPNNQTRAAIVALGFGVFLVGTISIVESNVRTRFTLDGAGLRANMAVLDLPPDRTAGVLDLLEAGGHPALDVVPIVAGRLHAVKGRSVDEMLAAHAARRARRGADSTATGGALPPRWALAREYRNSIRDTLIEGEALVAGAWWGDGSSTGISFDAETARALGVEVGDTVTWDFQGRFVRTEVASLRQVDWSRLEPNFLVLHAPGSLPEVPRTDLVLTRIEDPMARGEFQDRVTRANPGALVLDLTAIQAVVERFLDRASLATGFLGGFVFVAGLLILAAIVIASRGVRQRENALLRAMGARSPLLRGMLVAEFAALGALAGWTGVTLAAIAGWGLTRWVFEIPFALPAGRLAALLALAIVLTVALGVLGSRAVLRPPALAAIRRAEAVG